MDGITNKLIEQCRQGNRAAQKQLYYLSKDKLKRVALRYCKVVEDAQDAMQNAYVKIFKSIDYFDSNKGSFYTWSTKILVNECIMVLRKRKKMDLAGLDQVPEVGYEIKNLDAMTIQEIRKAMDHLNEDHRLVLNMLLFDELTYKEMSKLLGIKESSVRSKVTRARMQLKKIWSHFNMIQYEH